MNAAVERKLIRCLHLFLSIPIVGYIYGPVAEIPQARIFTQIVAISLILLSGIWLLQGHRIKATVPPQAFELSSVHFRRIWCAKPRGLGYRSTELRGWARQLCARGQCPSLDDDPRAFLISSPSRPTSLFFSPWIAIRRPNLWERRRSVGGRPIDRFEAKPERFCRL